MSGSLRQTGRTTKMLQRAMARMVEDDGHCVTVICACDKEAYYIQNLLMDFPIQPTSWSRQTGRVRYGKYSLQFCGASGNINRLRGLNRDNVFIDHHVWEVVSWGTLEFLHIWFC